MRITQVTIARNYTKGLHRSQSRLYELSDKASGSFRRFNTFAENTSGAVRAMNVRRSLAKLETDYDNIKTEVSRLTSAEGNLKQTNTLVTGFYEKYLQGADGSTGVNRQDVAVELDKLVDQMVSMANSQFSDTYLFGGAETKERIWDFDKSSDPAVLTYRGYDVMTTLNPDSPHFNKMKDADGNYTIEGQFYEEVTRTAYTDIGLGLETEPGGVKAGTAYKNTIDGLEIFGAGKDNIILQMHKMVTMMRDDPDFNAEVAGPEIEKLLEMQGNIRAQVTKVGSDYSYLNLTLDRLDTERINLQERQKDIEAIDPEVAIMNMKLQEYAYNAALQMGSRILQGSVFDYIR